MAVLFMDGFSHYRISEISRKWGAAVGSYLALTDTDPQHPGAARALYLPSNSAEQSVTTRTFQATDVFVVGGRFKFSNSVTVTGTSWLKCMDGSVVHLACRFDASGHIVLYRGDGTSVLYTSTNTLSVDTVYHIELKATIHDTAGIFELRVNGSSTGWIPQQTSQDTQNLGNRSVDRIYLRQANGVGVTISDFYVLDDAGSVANSFIGQVRIALRRTVGAGNYSQFVPNYTDNWENVHSEMGDDDKSFNQSSTTNDKDTFVMTKVPTGATIHGIQHAILCRQDAGGQKTIAPLDRISGSDYVAAGYNTSTSYVYHLVQETCSPVSPGTNAWTASELNGAEHGYKQTA